MIYNDEQKIKKHIKRLSNKNLVIRSFIIAVLAILELVSANGDSYYNHNKVLFWGWDILILAVGTILILFLWYQKRIAERFYLYVRCDPYTYSVIARRKNTKKNYLHNLRIDITTDFYTGKFEDCITSVYSYITSPKAKKIRLLYVYQLLCFSLFLTERNEECMTAMAQTERLWEQNKKFPWINDFSFIRKYIEKKYLDAIMCLQKGNPAKITDIRKVRISYFLALAYMQIGDLDSQKKCMSEIVRLDNKTYFASMAKQFLE